MHDLSAYWSADEIAANGIILLHLFGSLLVGLAIGYERSYHGRAAGMRTYALVCLASTLATVVCGYPHAWYGGSQTVLVGADPTRVIQGIMTGVGFLGAGVIMKEGLSIRGLSTAASVWITAAIGVALGVGFYAAAMVAALMVIVVMSVFRQLEARLPHQSELHLTLSYGHAGAPGIRAVEAQIQRHGLILAGWSYHHDQGQGMTEYQITLKGSGTDTGETLTEELLADPRITAFTLSPSRS